MKPATVRTNYGVLRTILRSAVDADLIAQSPCRGVRLPAETKRRRFLSADELTRLAEAMPAQYRAMVFLARVLGLRWSEVAGLRVGRICLTRRTLEIVETCAEVNGRISFAEPRPQPRDARYGYQNFSLRCSPTISRPAGTPEQTPSCSSRHKAARCAVRRSGPGSSNRASDEPNSTGSPSMNSGTPRLA